MITWKTLRQRTQSAVLVLLTTALLTPTAVPPLYAEDRENDDVEPYVFEPIVKPATFPDPLVLTFDEIAAAMKKGSPVLMSTKANREVLFYNRSQLAERQRNATGSVDGLMTAASGLTQMRSGLNSAISAGSSAGQVSQTDLLLKSAIDAQLAMTQSQLSSQMSSALTADKGYAQGGDMSASIDQMDDAALQVIYSAMALYQGYWSATRQIQRTEEELALLKHQLDVVTLLEELGRTTPQTKKSIADGIEAMEHGLNIARLEQKSLLNELNLMLGRSSGSTLQLQPIAMPDVEAIASLDRDSAWKVVYKESYVLKAKKHTQGGLQEQYDDVKKTYGEYGDRAWRAEQQLEGAKMNTALAAEQLQTRFNKFYEKLQQMIQSYRLEVDKQTTLQNTVQRTEQRYEVGYIAQSEVRTALNNLSKQNAVVAQSKDDLALAYAKWQLVLQGMDVGTGEKK